MADLCFEVSHGNDGDNKLPWNMIKYLLDYMYNIQKRRYLYTYCENLKYHQSEEKLEHNRVQGGHFLKFHVAFP